MRDLVCVWWVIDDVLVGGLEIVDVYFDVFMLVLHEVGYWWVLGVFNVV